MAWGGSLAWGGWHGCTQKRTAPAEKYFTNISQHLVCYTLSRTGRKCQSESRLPRVAVSTGTQCGRQRGVLFVRMSAQVEGWGVGWGPCLKAKCECVGRNEGVYEQRSVGAAFLPYFRLSLGCVRVQEAEGWCWGLQAGCDTVWHFADLMTLVVQRLVLVARERRPIDACLRVPAVKRVILERSRSTSRVDSCGHGGRVIEHKILPSLRSAARPRNVCCA